PCPPGNDAAAGGLAFRPVAPGPWAVRAVLQRALRAERAPVAEPVFRLRAGTGASVGGVGVRGTQPGAGRAGGLGRRVSLVERCGARGRARSGGSGRPGLVAERVRWNGLAAGP